MHNNHSTVSAPAAHRKPANAVRNQRGDQIASYLLAGALIAGALALLFSKYFVESNSSKVEGEVQNIVTIWKSSTQFRDVDGYASLTTAKLQTAKAIPRSMTGAQSGTLMHKWNGAVNITGTTGEFSITYVDVPADACLAMRPKLQVLDAFYSITNCATTGSTTLVMAAR